MLFPTIDFAVFFAVVFAITWALNGHNTWKKWWLVATSYYFYAFWRVEFTLLLAGSSVFNYVVALGLGRLGDGPWRRVLLTAAVAANLALLGYFKYYNFFAASLIDALAAAGINAEISFIEMALPIAISFLTFHALSYIIDVYRRVLKPTTSLVDILLYISFFPHLIAGPIVRADKFLVQTAAPRDPAAIRLGQCVLLILGGLFKKVIVANYLSTEFVDDVFRVPGDHSSFDLLFAMYAYSIQIYCDFSAYTDIAIGVAGLLGYEFPQNFNFPYRAGSPQDFWRRWHMSLSIWLRDYLYVSLGGNRRGELIACRNVMITMLLGGLWHGASWNFVIWGGLHGLALVIQRMLPVARSRAATGIGAGIGGVLGWFVTLQFVSLTWVFFRSPSIEASFVYFKTLFGATDWSTTVTPFVAVVFAAGVLTHFIPPRWYEALEWGYDRSPLVMKVLAPFVVIFLISAAAPAGIAPFIYFQF
jgi:D-alanyl-lipoteichoic acid acyltransferase DltB (MBOAT superfamily)